MYNTYVSFLEDINGNLEKNFPGIKIPLKIIGYAALELAGLPERGTKDLDALKTGALLDSGMTVVTDFLMGEFGKKSPGAVRHGIYLDFVAECIPWLPRPQKFIRVATYSCIDVARLDPVDVCASKVFSLFKSSVKRTNDKGDVFSAIDRGIVGLDALFVRVDNIFRHYEAHAEVAEVFPKVVGFMMGELRTKYCCTELSIKYEIPSWMENM